MNITLIGRTAPPSRAPLPSLTSRFTRSAGMYFRNAASPCAMSPMAPDRFSISVSRDGCRSHLVQIEALDMPDLADHLDQRRGDQALGEPRRQQPGKHDQHRKPNQQLPDRHLHRAEKFRFRHHRHQRPARKRDRRQHRLIGLAVPRHLAMQRLALARIVGAAGAADRLHRDRKQRMIGLQRHHLARRSDRAPRPRRLHDRG